MGSSQSRCCVIAVVLLSALAAGVDGQNQKREGDASECALCKNVLYTLLDFLSDKETKVRLLAAPTVGVRVVSLTTCGAFSGLPGLLEGQII